MSSNDRERESQRKTALCMLLYMYKNPLIDNLTPLSRTDKRKLPYKNNNSG